MCAIFSNNVTRDVQQQQQQQESKPFFSVTSKGSSDKALLIVLPAATPHPSLHRKNIKSNSNFDSPWRQLRDVVAQMLKVFLKFNLPPFASIQKKY